MGILYLESIPFGEKWGDNWENQELYTQMRLQMYDIPIFNSCYHCYYHY